MATMHAFNTAMTVHVKSLGPSASRVLARTAHEGEAQIIAEQTARKGVAPGHTEAVDGQQGKPFEEVQPGGTIMAVFDYFPEIITVAFQELTSRSPYVSGAYAAAHFCQLDGSALQPLEVPSAEQVKNVSRVTITNPEPYARKLEVGVTESGEPFVKQVSPFIYESATHALRHQYGSVAKITFNFVDLEGAYLLHASKPAHGRHTARRESQAGHALRYPCINIDR